jgi:hypothetical protein
LTLSSGSFRIISTKKLTTLQTQAIVPTLKGGYHGVKNVRLAFCGTVLAAFDLPFVLPQISFPFLFQGRPLPSSVGIWRLRRSADKALVPFLRKYFRKPNHCDGYMPGGGGRKAANYLYRSARPDGLTIGNPTIGTVSSAILGESGVLYDIDKFFYLGSPYSTYHAVFLSRKQAGFSNIEKLRAASGIRIGAQSVGFVTYNEGRLFAYVLGLRDPKFVAAYSGPEIDPALMRGEVDVSRTALTLSSGATGVARRRPGGLSCDH